MRFRINYAGITIFILKKKYITVILYENSQLKTHLYACFQYTLKAVKKRK